MKSYRLSLILVAFVLLFVTRSPILAYAELRRSDPPSGAVLDHSPVEVFVWFSEPLSTGSKLSVFDEQFQPVDKGTTFIDASDATLMRVQLAPLGPGRYTVNWTASTVDGRVSNGSYDFTVRESAGLSPALIAAGAGGLIVVVALVVLIGWRAVRSASRRDDDR
jgi:methionine-rich copper-binding protein CopC